MSPVLCSPQQCDVCGGAALIAANIRARIAAQVYDILFLAFALGWITPVVVHRYTNLTISAGSVAFRAAPDLIAIVTALAGASLYFLFFETFFSATVGKLLCKLVVRRIGHSNCGLAAAVVRTALRPFDAVFGIVLIAFSKDSRSLGDRIAGTVVLNLDTTPVLEREDHVSAEWDARTKATILDLAILAFFVGACLVATKSLDWSGVISIHIPGLLALVLIEIIFLYFSVFEALFGGTPGKLMCNLQVKRLDGRPATFVQSAVRALCKVLDVCTLGTLPFLLVRYTAQHRNIGDRLAGAYVVHALSD